MAEVKAQCDNQDFVDFLFSREWVATDLDQLKKNAYYRNDSDASFLSACHILSQGMNDETIEVPVRALCCQLLVAKLQKARLDPQYWHQHLLLFGGLDEDVHAFALKVEEYKANQSNDVTTELEFPESDPSSTVPAMIILQLGLGESDRSIFFDDHFALGYVFGMADMAYFQGGGSLEEQEKALKYISSIFGELFNNDAPDLLEKSMQSQQVNDFQLGKERGADEYGEWLESNGQVKPLGLSTYLRA